MSAPENTLYAFANALDLKQWPLVGQCLAGQVRCDYRDLRGTCETYSRLQYVQLRIDALQHLHTQHLFANPVVRIEADTAYCQCNAVIYRFDQDGQAFHTHAMYDFTLTRQSPSSQWQISTIKQTVLWNDGDASIHAGAKTS